MKNVKADLKNKWLGGAIILGLALYVIPSSCNSGPPENSRAAQAERGKVIYDQYCASCHGADGKTPIDSLERTPADLTYILKRRDIDKFPVQEIASIIDGRNYLSAHGDREMPAWGKVFADEEKLNDDQIRGKMGELISYLITIQR